MQKLKTLAKRSLGVFATLFLASCATKFPNNNYIIDYSNPSDRPLITKLNNAKRYGFTAVVLGDSHIAADIMTGALRKKLQDVYGKGSPGFIEPYWVSGQANQLFAYQSKDVALINARNQKDYDYRFGGYVASFKAGSWVEYSLRDKSPLPQENVLITARCTNSPSCVMAYKTDYGIRRIRIYGNGWKRYELLSKGFIRIEAEDNMEVAGLYLANKGKGVTLSSIGSNGATIAHLDNFGKGWEKEVSLLHPDLIILGYGTNESYNSTFNKYEYYRDYSRLISALKKANPRTTILLLSNPDSLNLNINAKLENGPCGGQQHKNSNLVHDTLQKIARDNKVMFWDWRAAMGGQCAMQQYIRNGQARKDGVHFTFPVYETFGRKLAQDLMSYRNP